MIKKRILYLFGFLFALSLFLSLEQVKAHNPSSMTLDYNRSSETLSVTITHSSENFNAHYIFEVIVMIGDTKVINQSYSSQPNNTFTYGYYISAGPLEILNYIIDVSARCTQGGIITNTIFVASNPQSEGIPGFAGLWFIIAASMIISIVFVNKKIKK
jgi:hypothetical protein